MSLPHEEGFALIKTALKEQTKEELHLTWLIRCWDSTSFADFYKEATTPEKSEKEILSEVENILEKYDFEKVEQ